MGGQGNGMNGPGTVLIVRPGGQAGGRAGGSETTRHSLFMERES